MNLQPSPTFLTRSFVDPLALSSFESKTEFNQPIDFQHFIHDLKNDFNVGFLIREFCVKTHLNTKILNCLSSLADRIDETVCSMKVEEKKQELTEEEIKEDYNEIRNKIEAIIDEFSNIQQFSPDLGSVSPKRELASLSLLETTDKNLELIHVQFEKVKAYIGMTTIKLPFNPELALRSAYATVKSGSAKKNITEFKIDIDPRLNAIFDDSMPTYSLSLSLSRIVTNLLTNADKYGLDFIHLEAKWIEDFSHSLSGKLEITVSDNGSGIIRDIDQLTEQEVAWQATYKIVTPRVQSDKGNSSTGSGLGGASLNQILTDLGGSLHIKTRGGGLAREYPNETTRQERIGTKITACIPLKMNISESKVKPRFYEAKQLSEIEKEKLISSHLQIIFIDDNIINRRIFKREFEKLNSITSDKYNENLTIILLGEKKDLECFSDLMETIKNKIVDAVCAKHAVFLFLDKTLGGSFTGNDISWRIQEWCKKMTESTTDSDLASGYMAVKRVSYSADSLVPEKELALYHGFLSKAINSAIFQNCLYQLLFGETNPTASSSDQSASHVASLEESAFVNSSLSQDSHLPKDSPTLKHLPAADRSLANDKTIKEISTRPVKH